MSLPVIDPINPLPPVCGEGEIREIDDPIVRIPPGEDSQGEEVSLPLEEYPEMVEHPAIAFTTVASLTRTGGKKADVLKGGAGHDFLNSGLGHDKLTGGEGHDVFVFSTKLGKTNVDRIADFRSVADTIQLSKAVFGKIQKGLLSKSAFCIGAEARDGNDRIIFDKKTGGLFYDADGSGTKYAAVKFAQLKAQTLLKADDFFIV